MKYRITAKGIIEQDNKILFIGYSDSTGMYYALPGGKQEKGESLADTVIREVKEETSLDVEVKELIMIREFILETSEIKSWEEGIQQIEAIFLCNLMNENQEAQSGEVPDSGMHELKWIDKKDFKNYRIYPTAELTEILEKRNVSYIFSKD